MEVGAVSGTLHQDRLRPAQAIQNNNGQAGSMEIQEKAIPNTTIENSGSGNNQTNKASESQIRNAIENANKQLKFKRTKCELTYHEDINRVAIKVIDKETEEVIREIPPEETLELVKKLWEMAGIIIDEKR